MPNRESGKLQTIFFLYTKVIFYAKIFTSLRSCRENRLCEKPDTGLLQISKAYQSLQQIVIARFYRIIFKNSAYRRHSVSTDADSITNAMWRKKPWWGDLYIFFCSQKLFLLKGLQHFFCTGIFFFNLIIFFFLFISFIFFGS